MARAHSISVAMTLLALTCAACTEADDPPASAATPNNPSTSSPSSPSSPSSSATSPPAQAVPRYLRSYAPREREAYHATLAAYADYGRAQSRILAIGKANPRARRYYKTHTGDWLTYWNQLRQREADGIQIKGRGEILRVIPSQIRLARDGTGIVDLRVCGVSNGVRVLQHGEPIPQPAPTPKIVQVRLVRFTGRTPWRVYGERVGGSC